MTQTQNQTAITLSKHQIVTALTVVGLIISLLASFGVITTQQAKISDQLIQQVSQDLNLTYAQVNKALSVQVGSTLYGLQKGYSYIISHPLGDTSITAMQNGTTGAFSYWSTNATKVLNFMIGNTTVGGHDYVCQGVYTGTHGLSITKQVTLEGSGWGTIFNFTSGSGDKAAINVAANNVTLENFEILATHLASGNSSIKLTSCLNFNIDNLYIFGGSTAINVYSYPNSGIVQYCHLMKQTSYGVAVNSNYASITENLYKGPVKIDSCIITGTSGASNDGIFFHSCANLWITNNQINNVHRGTDSIEFGGINSNRDINIVGNKIYNCTEDCTLTMAVSGTIASNNLGNCTHNTIDGTYFGFSITGNTCNNPDYGDAGYAGGLSLETKSSNNTITGNIFTRDKQGSDNHGIYIQGGASNNSIVGNNFINFYNGIVIASNAGTGNTITANELGTCKIPIDNLLGVGVNIHDNIGYVSSSDQTGTSTFTVTKDGTNYCATNSTSGALFYKSTNASQVINFAIGNLTHTSEQVVTLRGNITLTNSIRMASYMDLVNQGYVKLAAGSNCPLIDVPVATTHWKIIGGTYDGNAVNQASNSAGILEEATGFIDSYITGVRIYTVKGNGIQLANMDILGITGCDIEQCTLDGINGGGGGGAISACNIWLNGRNGIGGSFFDTAIEDGCTIHYNHDAGIAGTLNRVRISGDIFYANGMKNGTYKGSAIWISSGGSCTITGNSFEDNGGSAICMVGSLTTITGNHFVDNCANVTDGAVYIYNGGTYNTVSGNVFRNTGLNWQDYAVEEQASQAEDYNDYTGNVMYSGITPLFVLSTAAHTHDQFVGNVGYVTSNQGKVNNATVTTFSITHGLAGTPTGVWCSFNTTAVSGYSWTSTSSTITVTITGTSLPKVIACYWEARYAP